MSKARLCDRCGAIIKDDYDSYPPTIVPQIRCKRDLYAKNSKVVAFVQSTDWRYLSFEDKAYDLCNDCYQKVIDLIEEDK